MIQTISWMVKREPVESQPRVMNVTLRWFLLGGLVGGAVAGVLVAGPARLLYVIFGDQIHVFMILAVVVASGYLGNLLHLWRIPKPQVPRQVPVSWRDVFPLRLASFIYAAGLGLTFFTRIGSLATFPLAILALGFGGRPVVVIELFALTGLVRAATSLLVPLLGWAGQSGEAIFDSMEPRAAAIRRAEALILASGALVLSAGVFL
jgi:hypothetical protein